MNTTATDFAAPFDSADLQSLTDTVRRFATEQVRPHVALITTISMMIAAAALVRNVWP